MSNHRKDDTPMDRLERFMTRCAIAVGAGVLLGLALRWWWMP